MGTYVLRRLLFAIPVLWGIATVVFFLVFAVPGDPADIIMGQHGDARVKAAIHAKYHLDKPILVQYGYFMGRLVQLDLGRSYAQRRKVTAILLDHAGATILLAVASVAVAVVIGMGLGCLAAYKQGSWLDSIVMGISVLGISTPVFWLGLMAILPFCKVLGVIP